MLHIDSFDVHLHSNSSVTCLCFCEFYKLRMCLFPVDENDFSDLEKRYWTLKNQSASGKLDLATFQKIVCPPFPESVAPGKFVFS